MINLLPGNMFHPSTIPSCDLIVTRTYYAFFSDEDVIGALQLFHKALSKEGKVVIMDAVLSNRNNLNGQWNTAACWL